MSFFISMDAFMEDRKLKLNLDEGKVEEEFEDDLEMIPVEMEYDIKPNK